MSQLRRGTVAITNGQARVRGNYVATLTSVTGTFVAGETLGWAGGGAGVVTLWESVPGRLTFYRTAGPAPVASNVLTGGTSTAFGTVSGFTSNSTPNFEQELSFSGSGIPQVELVGFGILYSLAVAGPDYFDLSATYPGPTDPLASYLIWRDYTPLGIVLPFSGDVQLPSGMGRALSTVDLLIRGPVKTALSLGAGWTTVAGSVGDLPSVWRGSDGLVHLSGAAKYSGSLPSVLATLSAGNRPNRVRRNVATGTSGVATVEIDSTGAITVRAGAGGDLSVALYLDGIDFRAEA